LGEWRAFGNAVLLPYTAVSRFFAGALSNSFDEMYLLDTSHNLEFAEPAEILSGSFTPDRIRFDRDTPIDALTRMRTFGASTLLADGIGIGLNALCLHEPEFDIISAVLSKEL